MRHRWTIAGVRARVREALKAAGIEAEVVEASWLGVWCKPRIGGGSMFRCARVRIRAADGRTAYKAVTVERSGAWSVR